MNGGHQTRKAWCADTPYFLSVKGGSCFLVQLKLKFSKIQLNIEHKSVLCVTLCENGL